MISCNDCRAICDRHDPRSKEPALMDSCAAYKPNVDYKEPIFFHLVNSQDKVQGFVDVMNEFKLRVKETNRYPNFDIIPV